MKYCAIIFDLDGTLLDTSAGIINCYQQTAVIHGFPAASVEEIKKQIGGDLKQRLEALYGDFTNTPIEELVNTYRTIYKETGIFQARKYDGLCEMLSKLQKSSIKIGVATLKLESFAKFMLENFKILQYFDIVCGMDDDNKLNKSALIQNCLMRLNINDYTQAVMIGDSEYDALSAAEIGINFIGVTYGFGFESKADVMKYKNIGLAHDINSLYELLNLD